MSKRSFDADQEKKECEESISSPDFLVLDEVGKEFDGHKHFSRQDISRFLEINILKKRSNKTTILISNLDGGLEGFQKEYGQFVGSVIKSKLQVINMEGMDFRDIEKGNVDKFIGGINGKS